MIRTVNELLNNVRQRRNYAFAVIRRFSNSCVEQGNIDHSPCLGMKAFQNGGETRVLSDPELAATCLPPIRWDSRLDRCQTADRNCATPK